ncbi:MAG: hypothetical protein E6J74_38350 [Deltaproteobacteria bacterium]|nr:MAG: hypothetical protein E6J74_38350 [Deltaproteobacteria bacterium]
MAKSEHDWGTKEYDQEWVSKDSQRAAEREAQFNAAISWLAVFIGGRSQVMDLGCGPGTSRHVSRDKRDLFGWI